MKKILILLIIFAFSLSPLDLKAAPPKLNPKTKAFLLMTAYGTVGGFLLGSASLAFDTPGRAPFVGASLGLYAGLAFGSYVLASHYIENDKKLNPQKYLDDGGDSGGYGELPNQMLNQHKYEERSRDLRTINQLNKEHRPKIFIPVFNTSF